MRQKTALVYAGRIARLLLGGAEDLAKRPVHRRPWQGVAPLMFVAPAISAEHFNPGIAEILVFGSVAYEQPNAEVSDIDLVVLDHGFYSRLFLDRAKEATTLRSRREALRGNLKLLFADWFGVDPARRDIAELLEEWVDLHLLPVQFLADRWLRGALTRRQWDPKFFVNAFGGFLRYDAKIGEFVPADIAYLEKTYGCDLADLRVHGAALEPVLLR